MSGVQLLRPGVLALAAGVAGGAVVADKAIDGSFGPTAVVGGAVAGVLGGAAVGLAARNMGAATSLARASMARTTSSGAVALLTRRSSAYRGVTTRLEQGLGLSGRQARRATDELVRRTLADPTNRRYLAQATASHVAASLVPAASIVGGATGLGFGALLARLDSANAN